MYIDGWVKKMHTHTHKMKYYSGIKNNELMPFAATWMDLEIIILREASQTKTNIWYHLYAEPSFTLNIGNVLSLCFFLYWTYQVFIMKNIFKEPIVGFLKFYLLYICFIFYLLLLWYLVFVFLYYLWLLLILLVYLITWINIRFIETLQRQYEEHLYTFRSVLPNVNIF